MKCRILHESAGRIRLHAVQERMTYRQADQLDYYFRKSDGITDVRVYERTGDLVLRYRCERAELIRMVSAFSYDKAEDAPVSGGRELSSKYEEELTMTVVRRVLKRLFLPMPVRNAITAYHAVHFIWKGIRVLAQRKLEVPVLDATAISVSLLRRDFSTASSIMFLLHIGEILEEWTRKKSVNDLAQAMSLNVDQVWTVVNGEEVLQPVSDIGVGDQIIIRSGSMIPLDGKVLKGEASVNQASMTGESMPVRKSEGSYVYGGTVVEDGLIHIEVTRDSGSGRYDRIVKMIEESEKLKSASEDRASHLADHLVPYSLLGTLAVWLITANVTRALSVLMVDFSCALKLAIPISVLSAMKEGSRHHMTVKGGKFMEAVSEADTIVFDKTGTLTYATPTVAEVITFGENEEQEALRLAACLEEHFPHSMANAVVEEAKKRGLMHEERHTRVEYVVAHGISSTVDGKKVVIGSYHFVFQDEGCTIPEGEQERFTELPDGYSHLYMAVSGILAAVICIEDPIREEAADVIRQLKAHGISKVVMMTGDSERTAKAVAEKIGVDEYFSEVLPEDKAAFIRREHEEGRTVIMTGDGINDSPALSEADAGIAISTGAAIAREIADITIAGGGLQSLVILKELSDGLMNRINGNYRFIMGFNGSLIGLGVLGILQPSTSALLHNASTLAISLHSMSSLLND